jgi:hypothetical protein
MASESGRAVPAAAATTAAALPHAVVCKLLACLPADARARFATVCRAWRVSLAERSFWTRVDLSRSGGATCTVNDAALAAVAARAGGHLEALDASDCAKFTHEALLHVAMANAGALRELRFSSGDVKRQLWTSAQRLETLLREAPQLQILEADVYATAAGPARQLLRNEPPFGVVRMVGFALLVVAGADEAAVLSLTADMAVYLPLKRLRIGHLPVNAMAALDAVVDKALARRLMQIAFVSCGMSPTSAPALTRLLGSCDLTTLNINGSVAEGLLDGPAAVLLSVALRRNSTLTTLVLSGAKLWRDAAAANVLLGALIAHPSLRRLNISTNAVGVANQAAAGCAVGALVAANATALEELEMSDCNLGDAGMGHVIDALRTNTHLRTLVCDGNAVSDAFIRTQLLPAVRTNTTLRTLRLVKNGDVEAPLGLQLAQELFETRVANRR